MRAICYYGPCETDADMAKERVTMDAFRELEDLAAARMGGGRDGGVP
jgi:hypothetical protein